MNGDWITYLLILIFFVFPLIQQILETARKGRMPPPPPSDEPLPEEWTPARLPVPAQKPQREGVTATVDTSGGWSEGWGSWPGEMAEPKGAQLELPKRVATGAERKLPVWIHDLPAAEPEAEAEPVWVSTVETAEVPAEAEKPTRRPFPIAIPIVRGDFPARPRPHSNFASRMRSPARLRDAIILSEVLAPPKSLRSDDVVSGRF